MTGITGNSQNWPEIIVKRPENTCKMTENSL